MFDPCQFSGLQLEDHTQVESRDVLQMNSSVQEFLNGYDSPVLLSDEGRGEVLFANTAAEDELGYTEQALNGVQLQDLLDRDTIIRPHSILEHNDQFYLVQNEPVTYSGTRFVKSTLKPFPDRSAVSYYKLQQEMASRIVHRLRSPLTGIMGFAELLRERGLDNRQSNYIDAVEDGLDDLASVLSRLKLLGEDVDVQKSDVNISLLAAQIMESFPERFKDRIALTIDDDVSTIETDFILLKAMVEEIVVNAFEHGRDDTPVQLHFTKRRIRVHNEGDPIPEELTPNLFFPFFSGKARSMGIGLARCARYGHAMGINVELIENSGQQGVSFDIILSD